MNSSAADGPSRSTAAAAAATSGWQVLARFRYAALISWQEAPIEIPRTSYSDEHGEGQRAAAAARGGRKPTEVGEGGERLTEILV